MVDLKYLKVAFSNPFLISKGSFTSFRMTSLLLREDGKKGWLRQPFFPYYQRFTLSSRTKRSEVRDPVVPSPVRTGGQGLFLVKYFN